MAFRPVIRGTFTGCRSSTPGEHAGSLHLDLARLGGGHRTLAVNGLTHRAEHPPDHGFTHRHRGDIARPGNLIAFLDVGIFTEDGHTDGILFQVQDHAEDVSGELDQLAGHDVPQPVNAGDTIAHLKDRADAFDPEVAVVLLQLLRQDGANLFRSEFQCPSPRLV